MKKHKINPMLEIIKKNDLGVIVPASAYERKKPVKKNKKNNARFA